MEECRGLLIYALHVHKPGPNSTEAKSCVYFGHKGQQVTEAPYGARDTCSRNGCLLLPKLPRMIIPSSLSLLPLPDRCSIPRAGQYNTSMSKGDDNDRGPAEPWGKWQGQQCGQQWNPESPRTDGVWDNCSEVITTLLNFAFPIIPRKQCS